MFVSILDKLVRLNTRLLIGLSLTFVLASVLLVQYIIENSVKSLANRIENSLIRKGSTLTNNNAIALTELASDNSINAVGDLVDTTVQYDDDVIYGIYMDTEGLAWIQSYTTATYPLFFSDADLNQSNETNGRSNDNTNINNMHQQTVRVRGSILKDEMSLWARSQTTLSFREHPIAPHIIEFATPVHIESRKLGTIRYGFNAKGVQQEIKNAKASAQNALIHFCALLATLAIIAIIVGRLLSRRQGLAITAPIHQLTQASSRIAEGDYQKKLAIETNDEIKLLSENFEIMRCQIHEYTETLTEKVRARTAELEHAQQQALENAHKAGMAEIASGTIHNIGNILNSVSTSVYALREAVNLKRLEGLEKVNALLKAHSTDIEHFLYETHKGPQLIAYYSELSDQIIDDTQQISIHLERLTRDIKLITDAVSAQQEYASAQIEHDETRDLNSLVNEALALCVNRLEANHVTVTKLIAQSHAVKVHRNKFIHVLLNLVINAIDALQESPEPKINIESRAENDKIIIEITDNGSGITQENLEKIFQYGFTTKKHGHGFGLHACANYMSEMGGRLWATPHSSGAKFIIIVRQAPLTASQDARSMEQ